MRQLGVTGVDDRPYEAGMLPNTRSIEWAAAHPTITHAGLFLVCEVYAKRVNHVGNRFLRALYASMKYAFDSGLPSGLIFTWYLPARCEGRGRV